MRYCKILLAASLGLFAAGCQPAQKYNWGSYEDLVYVSYAEPGKIAPQEQIKILEADLKYSADNKKAVPPGVHAHLGYLYSKVGNKQAAQVNFEAEKHNFPESAILMDRLLSNLARM